MINELIPTTRNCLGYLFGDRIFLALDFAPADYWVVSPDIVYFLSLIFNEPIARFDLVRGKFRMSWFDKSQFDQPFIDWLVEFSDIFTLEA